MTTPAKFVAAFLLLSSLCVLNFADDEQGTEPTAEEKVMANEQDTEGKLTTNFPRGVNLQRQSPNPGGRLLLQSGCGSGYVPCDNQCMPAGNTCCHDGGSCPPTSPICVPNSQYCCKTYQAPCDTGCMTAGSVCCTGQGYFCDPGYTCVGNQKCRRYVPPGNDNITDPTGGGGRGSVGSVGSIPTLRASLMAVGLLVAAVTMLLSML